MSNPVTLAALAALAAAPAQAQSDDFQFRRDLAADARFVLRNVVGDVRIEPGSGRTVEVRAVRHQGRRGDPADVEIRAVDLPDGVAICVHYPGSGTWRDDGHAGRGGDRRGREDACRREGRGWSNDRNDTRVEFTVRVPADLRLDVKTVSGDVVARGLSGAVEVGTVSGDVQLAGMKGRLLDAASVSGDVQLDDVDAAEVNAETVSGDVRFAGPIRREGAYWFKTLSGRVELTLPGEPDARLRGSTFSGRLVSDFPADQEGRRRSRFSATWGRGSASIDVESFSGDVRIRRAPR
jgi:hypothetical protein